MASRHTVATRRALANKVPEVTVYFWIIKVLCTTVGETAADFLDVNLGLGLTGTSIATGLVLAVVMVFQFRADRYVPGLYWAAVALVSVFGTLVTDNLSDNVGVPLQISSVAVAVVLAVVFLAWYGSERTLSIHSITTPRREAFYWLAILFTFALGTATGDLMAEALSLGYGVTLGLVAGLIVLIAVAWRLGLDPVLAFWIIYICTRPLGASFGDLLAQPPEQGGLGLGTTITSVVFLGAILVTVVYLSATRTDVIDDVAEDATEGGRRVDDRVDDGPTAPVGSTAAGPRHGLAQTVVVVAVLLAAIGAGYGLRISALRGDAATASPAAASPAVAAPGAPPSNGATAAAPGPNASLGDLSPFRTITQDTADLLDRGDQSGATARVTDLETAWDQAQGRLDARDDAAWTRVDGKVDAVLTALRASTPDPGAEKAALTDLLAALR